MIATIEDIEKYDLSYVGASTWILAIKLTRLVGRGWIYLGYFHDESDGLKAIDLLHNGARLEFQRVDGELNKSSDWKITNIGSTHRQTSVH